MVRDVLEVVIKSRPDQFIAGMESSTSAAQRFSVTMDQVARTVMVVGGQINSVMNTVQRMGRMVLAGGTGIAAGLAGSTMAAAKFEVGLRNINTLIPATERNMSQMSDVLLEMSTNFPQSAEVLSEGLYDITSSGLAGAQAFDVLEVSAKAATAGLTTTGTSAATIMALINAYGMSAADATDLSDILFETVNWGVLSFEELASTTGEWVSMAAAAGVAADEAAAALAVMTLTGMSAGEASTSLSRIMTEFVSPGEAMSQVLAELGFESGTAMLSTLGLRDAMFTLQGVTGGTAEAFSALFPDIRGTRGALALLANEGQNYLEVGDRITDVNQRAGATQQAFAEQSKSVSAQMQILTNNIMALTISIGQVFLPVVNSVVGPLNSILSFINDMPGPIKSLIAVLSAATAGLMIFSGIVAGFLLKQALWALGMRKISDGLLQIALNTKNVAASNALTRLSSAFDRMGRAGGPLGSVRTGIEAVGKAIQLAGSRYAPTFVQRLTQITVGLTKLAAVSAVVAVGVLMLTTQWGRAEEAGRRAGEQFAKALQATNTQEARNNLETLRERMEELADSSRWIRMTEDGPIISKDDFFQGNLLEDVGSQIQGTLDFIRGGRHEAEAEMAAIADAMTSNLKRVQYAEEALRRVVQEDIMQRHGGWEGSGLQEFLRSGERDMKRLERLAIEAGVNIINEFDPYAAMGSDEHNRFMERQKEIEQSLRDIQDANDGASANAVAFEQDMLGLADAFQNAKTELEALEKVLKTALDIDFGLEEAVDNFNSALNETYKQIQDIKGAGTLGDALDPTSMHEDAIALRGSLRGIVEEAAAVAVEWAKAQPNLTGSQFTNFLEGQANEIAEAMRSMGVAEEQIERYTRAYRELAQNPDLEMHINNNFTEAAQDFDGFMAQVGLAPEEITTALTIAKERGLADLEIYLTNLGRTPEQITTATNLIVGESLNQLREWNELIGLAEGDVDTLLKLQVEGDQAAIDAFLSDKGVSQKEYEAFVSIVGKDNPELTLDILNAKLKELSEKEVKVGIGVLGPYQEINNIDAALDALARKRVNIAVKVTGNFRELFQQPLPGGIAAAPNADGNLYENHQAEIAPGGAWRIWAEPETGGEAYIPLAASKRQRSMGIFQQVAEIFGVKAMFFQSGGIDFSTRVRGGGRSGGGGSGGGGGSTQQTDWARNQFRAGALHRDDWLNVLRARLAGLREFSDEWTDTMLEIRDLEEAAADEAAQHWEGIWQAIKNMFEVGDMSDDEMVTILEGRLGHFQKYTKEWMEAHEMLQDINEKRTRKEEEARDLEDRKQQLALRQKKTTDEQYLAYLRTRLGQEKEYSDRWFSIQNEIIDREEEIVEKTKRQTEESQDIRFARGEMTLNNYLAVLRNRLNAAKQYSAEWDSIMQQIEGLTGAAALRSEMSMAPFLDAAYVSEATLLRYYERKATKAQEWSGIVQALGASGMVSTWIMQDLVQAGPASLPLARTLAKMVTNGNIHKLNNSFQQINATATFTAAPVQPSASGAGAIDKLQGLLSNIDKLVNIEKLVVTKESDIDAISKRLAFDVRSTL